MMRRLWGLVLILCLWALPAQAQLAVQGNLGVAEATVTLQASNQAGVSIQVQGTFVGTITFEVSVDGVTYTALNLTPSNSATPASTTTTTGIWMGGAIGATVRARMSAYTSGVAGVNIRNAASAVARGLGGTVAPVDATYITQTANSALTAEQALGTLSTGLLHVTTTTGVVDSLGDILPGANGGTANGFTAFTGPATSLKTFTLPNASSTLLYSGGPLGTPSSGTLTSATGLPISTGVSGLGTDVATWLGTPSSANLAAAVTGETGSGALVFDTSPVLVTPTLGIPVVTRFSTINGITTAGNFSVPTIVASARATGQTATNASVATYTVGAADGSFEVSANVLVTTSSAEAFAVQVEFTDEGNTARTMNFGFRGMTAGQNTIAFANGAIPYLGQVLQIRAKTATAITIRTEAAGTYTGCTYNVEGIIKQVA